MSSHAERIPRGRDADARWAGLGMRRRLTLALGGGSPETPEEAATALGYAHRLLERGVWWPLLAAAGAVAVSLALSLLVGDGLTTGAFVLAGGLAVGVGLGFGVGGRLQARRLQRSANEVLSED